MATDTRDKILDTALIMFSENGYNGTNIREIAEALGLAKSAIYKHFQSKEDILNGLLDKMEAYYSRNSGSQDNLPPVPKTCDELSELTVRMTGFTIHDEGISRVRKLLLIEQFRNERIKTLATKHFITDRESVFEKIFSVMMAEGTLKKCDPHILAFAFTTPISALIQLCDREPDREQEAVNKIKEFVEMFIEQYGVK